MAGIPFLAEAARMRAAALWLLLIAGAAVGLALAMLLAVAGISA